MYTWGLLYSSVEFVVPMRGSGEGCGTGEGETAVRMGEKYTLRGVGSKSSFARHNAKVVLPMCTLLVFFVWNSPTLAPFDGASSGPVHDMVAGQHEALSSQYTTLQHEVNIFFFKFLNIDNVSLGLINLRGSLSGCLSRFSSFDFL